MKPNPLPDPLKRLSEEIERNKNQERENNEIADNSSRSWVVEKTTSFLSKVDQGFDNVIVSVLRSITNGSK